VQATVFQKFKRRLPKTNNDESVEIETGERVKGGNENKTQNTLQGLLSTHSLRLRPALAREHLGNTLLSGNGKRAPR
jgi:hypothetical protein